MPALPRIEGGTEVSAPPPARHMTGSALAASEPIVKGPAAAAVSPFTIKPGQDSVTNFHMPMNACGIPVK